MKKTIYALLICSTLAVALPSLSITSFAKPAVATEKTAVEATSDITARKAITEWRYKVINGKLYRRLYDTTHEKWLTDWLPC